MLVDLAAEVFKPALLLHGVSRRRHVVVALARNRRDQVKDAIHRALAVVVKNHHDVPLGHPKSRHQRGQPAHVLCE
ncbi:hypothetical protein SDC9_129379 [bioreactor metagenome]|uniref:Uncharacterized protein n=1 Tax=bioreactor metagenome TaxID=1076179 RepID=A0A645CZP1_9ZZZZ